MEPHALLAGLPDAMDEQAAAAWTWLSLVRGHADFPGRLGETTLTEFLQAQLWDRWTGQVVYKVPHEPTTGADWEWYVGLADENLWVCIRVQAKILSSALTFASIGHRVGGRRQMDVLIDASRSNACQTFPYYVFYVADISNDNGSSGIRLPLYGWHAMPKDVPREHFGCTAVSAHQVRMAYDSSYGSRNQPKIYLPFGFPWSELLRVFTRWTAPTAPVKQSGFQLPLRRLLQLLNGVSQPTSQEALFIEATPVLREWLSAFDRVQPSTGSLPDYAASEFVESRNRTRLYRESRTSGLTPARFRPEPAQAQAFATRVSQAPILGSVETRVVVRRERPEGAPRLGMSFLDLAADDTPKEGPRE